MNLCTASDTTIYDRPHAEIASRRSTCPGCGELVATVSGDLRYSRLIVDHAAPVAIVDDNACGTCGSLPGEGETPGCPECDAPDADLAPTTYTLHVTPAGFDGLTPRYECTVIKAIPAGISGPFASFTCFDLKGDLDANLEARDLTLAGLFSEVNDNGFATCRLARTGALA